MDLEIAGRKAIVCASSRGLGRGAATALAEAGCELVLNGRDRAALDATAGDIRQRTGATVHAVAGDISQPDVQRALLAACPAPDILINNNGGPPRRNFHDLDRDQILAGVVNNMVTPIELIRAVVDGMGERGFGRILNITSSSVLAPIEGLDLSSGARAGLTAYLAGVCREVASRNVTINSILPGRMRTARLTGGWDAVAKRAGITIDKIEASVAAEIPAKRLGTPEEFGQICAFLCSAHAGYITGQNILVDGGLVARSF